MFKFFRRIRQRLLSENNISKYLIYAVGEIILVVLGILIALSINNWNQNRMERDREQLVLAELTIDLEEQIKLIDSYIESESSYYQNGVDILEHYAAEQTFYGDAGIYSKLNALISRRTFNPLNTTFQELISTGSIGIISSKETKREILKYYHEQERISLIITNDNIHIVDGIIQPVIFQQTIYTTDEVDPRLKKMNDQIFNEGSLNSIQNTSRNILSDPDKTLNLFNIVEQRTLLALLHIELYKSLQLKTKELLSMIKNQI